MNKISVPGKLRKIVVSLALALIAISGWFVWSQLADAQRLTREAGSKPTRSAPSFDMSRATIPVDKVRRGGPPKDGIPALTAPPFVPAANATFMLPEDRVIGVTIAGEAKAYPHKILDYHEAVNDRLGDQLFLVTYCPLCDSSAVFDRRFGDKQYEFGISGLLYNSNVLLYDRSQNGPESLWSQMASAAVTSDKSGQALKRLPMEVTTWGDWSTRYPETQVLSTETGYQRSYDRGAYQNYFTSPRLMFPVEPLDDRLSVKTPVLGVMSERVQRAYPLTSFAGREENRLTEEIDGHRLTLVYDPKHQSLRVEQADPGLEWMYSFWFAWSAFYPETEIFQTE